MFSLLAKTEGVLKEQQAIQSHNYMCEVKSGSTYELSIQEKGEPRCFPKCPTLPSIPNGEVDYPNREPDTTATYSCNNGFVLVGQETRKCGQDGQWTGEQPSCVPLCPVLPNIQNGTVRYRTGKKEPAAGDIAIYSCNEEHRLKGEATRECGEDGKWLGVEPKCEPECVGQPPTPIPVPPAPAKCPELNLTNIPKNVPEVERQLRNHPNHNELIYKSYYSRRIEGDRSEGSKAHLKCLNGWKLIKGTPSEQECVKRNGELVWTMPGTCVYRYSKHG